MRLFLCKAKEGHDLIYILKYDSDSFIENDLKEQKKQQKKHRDKKVERERFGSFPTDFKIKKRNAETVIANSSEFLSLEGSLEGTLTPGWEFNKILLVWILHVLFLPHSTTWSWNQDISQLYVVKGIYVSAVSKGSRSFKLFLKMCKAKVLDGRNQHWNKPLSWEIFICISKYIGSSKTFCERQMTPYLVRFLLPNIKYK